MAKIKPIHLLIVLTLGCDQRGDVKLNYRSAVTDLIVATQGSYFKDEEHILIDEPHELEFLDSAFLVQFIIETTKGEALEFNTGEYDSTFKWSELVVQKGFNVKTKLEAEVQKSKYVDSVAQNVTNSLLQNFKQQFPPFVYVSISQPFFDESYSYAWYLMSMTGANGYHGSLVLYKKEKAKWELINSRAF